MNNNVCRLSDPPRLRVIQDEPEPSWLDAWHWPSFVWGLWTGVYVCMATVGAAWLWSFYL